MYVRSEIYVEKNCNNSFSIHIRVSEERLVSGFRDSSILLIIAATEVLRWVAIFCNTSKNSFSSEILVWWPDKDTDIFFIFYIFPTIKQSIIARYGSSYTRKTDSVRLSSI